MTSSRENPSYWNEGLKGEIVYTAGVNFGPPQDRCQIWVGITRSAVDSAAFEGFQAANAAAERTAARMVEAELRGADLSDPDWWRNRGFRPATPRGPDFKTAWEKTLDVGRMKDALFLKEDIDSVLTDDDLGELQDQVGT